MLSVVYGMMRLRSVACSLGAAVVCAVLVLLYVDVAVLKGVYVYVDMIVLRGVYAYVDVVLRAV
jgi:hypothetical protein